ncbi:MAG: cupin domain-containing protein [Methylobacterium mesophilicum]|nr:cupin domain-containing protein [Methylobacterium mesophilicum]
MDEVQTFTFGPENGIPNSDLPLLFAKGAVRSESGDATTLLEENGWAGIWVFTVYPFWHFHTKGHEVLIGVQGTALIGFGGERGIEVEMKPGDLALIPAGVGHKRLCGDNGFQVAGGYPPGQSGNIVRPGELGANEIEQELAALTLPQTDPLTGQAGGLLNLWRLIAE